MWSTQDDIPYLSPASPSRGLLYLGHIGHIFLHQIVCWKQSRPKEVIVLKMDMLILTCIFFTFNWLTLTSEMHFVKFHHEVASCLLSRGKRKYAPLGMRLLWKYIRNFFLVYHLTSHFLLYLQNYKEFEAEILDLQLEKYGLSFDIKKYTSSGWALGDENVISIRSFKLFWPMRKSKEYLMIKITHLGLGLLNSYSK